MENREDRWGTPGALSSFEAPRRIVTDSLSACLILKNGVMRLSEALRIATSNAPPFCILEF